MYINNRVSEAERPPITIRDLNVSDLTDLPDLWCGNEIYFTTLMNSLSCLFPIGEKFFIRSIRGIEKHVDSARLKNEIRLFCAQEALHGKKYERFNQWIDKCGFPIAALSQVFESQFFKRTKLYGPVFNLALTAALEHLTATMSQSLLESPKILEKFHSKAKPLVVWHAVEEIEHKAVAFDVLQEINKSYFLRILAMLVACTELSFGLLYIMVRCLVARRQLFKLASLCRLISLGLSSGFVWTIVKGVCAYFRPNFHPWDSDDRALLAHHLSTIEGNYV